MSWASEGSELAPLNAEAAPTWLKPLVDNAKDIKRAYRRRVSPEVLAMLTAANKKAAVAGERRDAAVLVLFSGPPEPESGSGLAEADLLVTVRASTLRHHAGQAAFPGGAADPGDVDPVHTALREANEETGIDVGRLQPLTTLERMFIPPSGFHVVPVLAYSPDPGPVTVVDESETAVVARVPLRAFVNPENRIMVYRKENARRSAGPAFLLNEMLVWGFTGQVVSAMLDVAGWAQPWNTDDVRELEDAMALVRRGGDPAG
ncbi:coenzyme A pyrophosphatase [Mycolicibacterium moriokaense]|uniref:Coenzyme A pyrophosphatase n=1 Tax=Mycolicibacterium moriokaense TaxID=39691 RepID=A0AAD1H8N4_9MYCO|nr:CoA pyrophosphatase [Mycolicibacterium moriokaense]MCV7040129.1 CoA pyrophosphatase [Mycolicibacterium moriokaense]ORB20145.1 coenzyme A pyrophosphatase [Mycolicibacterium moriokaense]BBX00141.1 coenzyme A pyrophosphatase [Mycolicibacterium moriokaense]